MNDEKETTVYKRAMELQYKLKIKSSRAVFGEVRLRVAAGVELIAQRGWRRQHTGATNTLACHRSNTLP